MLTSSAPVRVAAFILAAAALTACVRGSGSGGASSGPTEAASASPSATAAPATAAPATAAPATPAPVTAAPVAPASAAPSASTAGASPSSAPVYTGPATLIRSSRPYSGRVVDALTFVDCANATIRLLPTDSVTPGGSCATSYDFMIRRAAQAAAQNQTGSAVVINSVSQEGDTAVATYASGNDVGQVLLSRSSGKWFPKTVTSGALPETSGTSAGVPAATLHRLQRKLPFDVTSTPLPARLP